MEWEELRARYAEVLARVVGVPGYQRFYYCKWLGDYLEFCRIRHLGKADRNGLAAFLEGLRKGGRLGFQVEQARVAVEVYWMHFQVETSGHTGTGGRTPNAPEVPGDWRMAMDTLVKEIRLRRYSVKTSKAYVHWVRDFSRFVSEQPVRALTPTRVRDFMSHLAMERKVAAATQNQAFSALLFFYTSEIPSFG